MRSLISLLLVLTGCAGIAHSDCQKDIKRLSKRIIQLEQHQELPEFSDKGIIFPRAYYYGKFGEENHHYKNGYRSQ